MTKEMLIDGDVAILYTITSPIAWGVALSGLIFIAIYGYDKFQEKATRGRYCKKLEIKQ